MNALDQFLDQVADALVDRVLSRVAERLSGKPEKAGGGGVISRPPANGSVARRAALPRRRTPKQLPASMRTSPDVQKRIDDVMRFVEKGGSEGVSAGEIAARFASFPNLRGTLRKARALGLLKMTGTKQSAKYFPM